MTLRFPPYTWAMSSSPIYGRRRRTPQPGHFPTDRTHANHTDRWSVTGTTVHSFLPCARCNPDDYARRGAKHRSDRP